MDAPEDRPVPPPSAFMMGPILVLVGGLLFAALLTRQRDLVLLCLLLLITGGAAGLWARLSLSGLSARAARDRLRLFPGDALTLSLTAENRRWLPVFLRAVMPLGGLLGSGRASLVAESGLLWHQTVTFRWEVAAARRGVYLLGPHRLTAGDLLGFFSRDRRGTDPLQVVVYPRIVPLRAFPLPRRDFFGIPGAEGPVQDPVYILGTREYQPGRPAKHIHWKASARHHRLHEKLFEPTAQEKILLMVDVSGFAGDGAAEAFERTLEAAASLAVRLDREGCAVGLLANGVVTGGGPPLVAIGRGPQQLPAILELLARLDKAPAAPLLALLRNGGAPPWGASVIGFACDASGGILAALEHLARRQMPVRLFIARPTGEGEARAARRLEVRPLDSILAGGAS